MEIVKATIPKHLSLAAVVQLLKEDYAFNRFAVLPGLAKFQPDPRWMAETAKITLEQTLEWIDLLVNSGLWTRENGTFEVVDANLNYSGGVADYLTINASVASRLTDNGPCWFNVETLVTSEDNYQEFVSKVYSAIEELKSKSAKTKGDKLISLGFQVIREVDHSVKGKQ